MLFWVTATFSGLFRGRRRRGGGMIYAKVHILQGEAYYDISSRYLTNHDIQLTRYSISSVITVGQDYNIDNLMNNPTDLPTELPWNDKKST